VTLFDSVDDDTLVPAGPPGAGFRNAGSVDSQGVEVEWSAQLAPWLKVTANATKIETQSHKPIPGNEDPDVDAFGTPDLLANVGLIMSPTAQLTLGANWNHVGDRFSTTGDLDGYDNLTLSGEYRFARWDGLAVRVALRNATDDEITHVLGRPPPLGPNVLDYGGRLWTAQLSYRF
jgi:outer membrane receptor protein involved in Fe transport